MATLLLLQESLEDEPAQQRDVANGFSNRSDGRPESGVQPDSLRWTPNVGQPEPLPKV